MMPKASPKEKPARRRAPETERRAWRFQTASSFSFYSRTLGNPQLLEVNQVIDLSSVRWGVAGAAPCPWELAVEWREKSGTRIVRGYGMTELFRPLSFRANDSNDVPNAVGKAVPGVENVSAARVLRGEALHL